MTSKEKAKRIIDALQQTLCEHTPAIVGDLIMYIAQLEVDGDIELRRELLAYVANGQLWED